VDDEAVNTQTHEPSLILGELRGQLKELIHSTNNLHGKVDGMGREVMAITFLAKDVSDLKVQQASFETRLGLQEKLSERNLGGREVVGVIMKSPVLGWMFVAAAILYAIFRGQIGA
jgi:hypothetical protein